MKVILTQDVNNVGKKGEIKEVADGLARNYLLPKKLAVKATPGNINSWKKKIESIRQKDAKILEDAKAIAEKLNEITISIEVKAGEENKLFGSVTSQHIADKLKEKGFHQISKKEILLEEPIKTLGNHEVRIKLHPEVVVPIIVEVVKEES